VESFSSFSAILLIVPMFEDLTTKYNKKTHIILNTI
jgi:hypothetical protein